MFPVTSPLNFAQKTLDFEKIQMDKKRLKDDAGALDVIIYFAAIVGVTGRALLFILLGKSTTKKKLIIKAIPLIYF